MSSQGLVTRLPSVKSRRRVTEAMKIAVIGAGMMGAGIAWDLSRSRDVDEVVVADISRRRLAAVKERLGEKGHVRVVDASDRERVKRFLKGADAAVSALPHG